MASLLLIAAILTSGIAILWQAFLKEPLFVTLGVGRALQLLEDFPYSCRRIYHPDLEGCEDMWLDDETRIMYLACSSTEERLHWNPAMGGLNATGRKGDDHMTMLDIDSPVADGLFNARRMKFRGDYCGAFGSEDKTISLHGFDVEDIQNGKLRFWLINHRSPIDESGKALDAFIVGQNSSIEVFEAQKGGEELNHIKTLWNEAVFAPNKIAVTGDGGFVNTNDRSTLEFITGGGSVASCSGGLSDPSCRIAAANNFTMPNGLVRGKDGLFYVPSSGSDDIKVMALESDRTLKQIDQIRLGMPVDNLAVDANGDIWAAAIPKVLMFTKALEDPRLNSPVTVFKIRKAHDISMSQGSFEVQKVLEDREGKIVSSATVVRHDVKTGRLFIAGFMAPFISVCDPVAA